MEHDRHFYPEGQEEGEPIPILTISGGKGGVGKTVIAANLARLLSWSEQAVLLVDLDLYNRGATALIADLVTKEHATLADLLVYADARRLPELPGALEKAPLIQAPGGAGSLLLLPSSRYNQQVSGAEYRYEVAELKAFLRVLLRELIRTYAIRCVVFDCRSGPEPLFLAAAGLSTDTVLVTEPDMVTWAGNLNLFNYTFSYYRHDAETLLNVQFVLNRVSGQYDEADLERVYQRRLSRFLKGRRILATIPFDYGVFETFTQHVFFVDEAPSSPFSRRIAAIADELFATTHAGLLSDGAKKLAASGKRRGLRSMFRRLPAWANVFLVLGVAYACAGLLLLKGDGGRLGQVLGLLSLGAAFAATALGLLPRLRFLG